MDDLRKPILPGKGASDYERYLRTDELLSLQKSPEEFLHPDEMTFQVVHQASELLLKGVTWELERARTLIADGNFGRILSFLLHANAAACLPPAAHGVRLFQSIQTTQPWPRLPTMFLAGTRTLSKNTSLKSASPVI